MASVSGSADTGILSVEQLLERSKNGTSGKGAAVDPSVLTADQLLARSQARVNGQRVDAISITSTGLSEVQRSLAAVEAAAKAKATPYTEQDWYIRAKVAQLKGQVAFYTNLPDMDPGGNIMNALTKEIRGLLTKQADKMKALKAKADEAQKKLDAQKAADAAAGPSAEDLLAKVTGKSAAAAISPEVQALLDKSKTAAAKKGSSVNTSA